MDIKLVTAKMIEGIFKTTSLEDLPIIPPNIRDSIIEFIVIIIRAFPSTILFKV